MAHQPMHVKTYLDPNDPRKVSVLANLKESPTTFVRGTLQLWNIDNVIKPVVVLAMANTTHLPPNVISQMRMQVASVFWRLLREVLLTEHGSRALYKVSKDKAGNFKKELYKQF